MTDTIADRLAAHGITLPDAAAPAANYVPTVLHNGLLYISGQLPIIDGAVAFTGTLGDGVSIEDAQQAAKLCGINILAQAQTALGDLERIDRLLRVGGFVAATPVFTEHPAVLNGASDLLADVLGARGAHTRVAVGVASLPFGASVEVDALIAVKN
ncbi:MAG: RidA family protein [Pseudomonadota bacterium]